LIRFVILLILFCSFCKGYAQVVFEPSQNSVYPFLDEMAAEGYVRVNTFAKPFSRKYISNKLDSLNSKRDELTKRQREQLDFFLRDYRKEQVVGKEWDRRLDLFYHSDSTFNLTVNPIFGGSYLVNSNGDRIHTRIGGEFFANFKNVGIYGSLRDNTVSEAIALPQQLTALPGQNYKSIADDNRSDYNEAMGGISYSWKWGDISLIKDRNIWGNTERHANILSGKAPSFASLYLRIQPIKWLDFQYMHGWLISEELDSARTYLTPNGNRRVYMNKNIAANFLTIKTNWKVDFTAGNSVIYSDNGFEPVYFIPFMFWKSVDHTYSGTGSNELGQNSQMFFDVSVRSLKKVHFYGSLFIDEISLSNFWDSDEQTNILSYKLGATWFNVLPNLHLTAEYTRNRPWVYRHQISSTTFESNRYNMGHYLGENADELYMQMRFWPWRMLKFTAAAWLSRKGPRHEYDIINGNANVTGLQFMESVEWERLGLSFSAQYEITNGAVVFLNAVYTATDGDENYTPDLFLGNTFSTQMGFRIGL